jgi:hypothetical protein
LWLHPSWLMNNSLATIASLKLRGESAVYVASEPH